MFAVEFQTNIKNGVIEIPPQHQQELGEGNTVKVIIMKPNKKTPATGMIAQLISNPVQVEDFTPLSRDEAHER